MSTVQVVCHFKFLCSRTWDDLQEVSGTTSERFCPECLKPVYLVSTYQDLKQHVKKSHCVALQKSEGGLMMGAIWRTNKVDA